MRARYYNPCVCRFINADPSGFSGGLNHYAYADGNPINLIDPFGLGAIGKDAETSWLSLMGNGLNNTVSAIGQSMGQELYDLYNGLKFASGIGTDPGYSWRQSKETYADMYDLMYSVETPANPAATPYIAASLGVSGAAAVTALGAGLRNVYATSAETSAIDQLFRANRALDAAWKEVRLAELQLSASADSVAAGSQEWKALMLQVDSAYFRLGVAEGNVVRAQEAYQAAARAAASFFGF
jgi:hypothetical protein